MTIYYSKPTARRVVTVVMFSVPLVTVVWFFSQSVHLPENWDWLHLVMMAVFYALFTYFFLLVTQPLATISFEFSEKQITRQVSVGGVKLRSHQIDFAEITGLRIVDLGSPLTGASYTLIMDLVKKRHECLCSSWSVNYVHSVESEVREFLGKRGVTES